MMDWIDEALNALGTETQDGLCIGLSNQWRSILSEKLHAAWERHKAEERMNAKFIFTIPRGEQGEHNAD